MTCFGRCLVFLVLPMILGCAAVALTGAGFGANYTLTNVAHKTFNSSLDQADKATVLALKKMDIEVVSDNETDKGRRIKAATQELDIIVDLERVTSKATKIKVNAKKGLVLKDKATAGEIIAQVGKVLEGKG